MTRLSGRELEALSLTASGLDRKSAAERMCVAPDTVKKYLGSVYAKTGASNLREALVALGWLRIPQ